MSAPTIAIATNNGDVGGGEVMLLNIAEGLRGLGIDVLVLGPEAPGELVAIAQERGFRTVALSATNRRTYISALLRWRVRNRRVPLWCNGLVPSFATTGIGPRLVHLHILPTGRNVLAASLARLGARRLLVPSSFMASRVTRSTVLKNWTEEIPFRPSKINKGETVRIGFIGRFTRDKGVDVLARAVSVVAQVPGLDARLVLAGENRFGDDADDRAIAEALAPLGERVERTGWITREEFFAGIDLAVFPSIREESFGLVAAESMAAGVPFIVSDSGALPEVAGVAHPWVARRGDAIDLAHVILQAIDDIERGDERRAADARVRWEQSYSPAAGASRIARLLQGLEGPSRTGRATP